MTNDRLRVIRDQIGPGDDVLVVGHGSKPRTARIINVLRSAVRVRYADAPGTLHTVLLKEVRRVEEPAPPPRASTPPPEPRASTPRVKPAKLDEPPPPASAPPTDFETWLDMGREELAKVDGEISALTAQAVAIADDITSLTAELDQIGHAREALVARKDRIEKVLKS